MKQFILLMTACIFLLSGCQGADKPEVNQNGEGAASEQEAKSPVLKTENGNVYLEKCTSGNPIAGTSDTGDYIYGGDPSVLVDGDTVYLYTGHDISTDTEVGRRVYNIPEYLCYSSKDLKEWKAEGSVMTLSTKNVSWVRDSSTAWASQVIKHYDKAAGKEQYYLYFCSWDQTSEGKQSIGVAVSDSPTGPFVDKGEPLVKGTLTEPQSSAWDDIDPTVFVDTDENGEEHRYLAWGNSNYFICELNEDMISVRDINGDGKITCDSTKEKGDILNLPVGLNSFTEAPWIYRRKDADGKYYGNYYLFYAYGWRERMAYATTDNLMDNTWRFGSILMSTTATSNTNHMAVFDFKGKTYFVYHNGSLPAGNGYRRSACITELKFKANGDIEPIFETAAGIDGRTVSISDSSGKKLSHENFLNDTTDDSYPYRDVPIGMDIGKNDGDVQWVLRKGKAKPEDETYVSIESENKPGLYLTAGSDGAAVLSQDTDAGKETAKSQTFHSVEGLGDKAGVSFESVSAPGKYLAVKDGKIMLTDGGDAAAATFYVK